MGGRAAGTGEDPASVPMNRALLPRPALCTGYLLLRKKDPRGGVV